MTSYILDVTSIPPLSKNKPRQAIVLCHGYGGDGKDISMLALNWKRFLTNVIFLCPDAHERCSINPNGFQWFDLTKEDPQFILEQSIKAEKKLHQFIDEVKKEFKLENSQICLCGFSQGCMMSINLGLTSNENFNCIVGFSGKVIDKDNLSKRKISNTKMLLLHGDLDEVVPSVNLLEVKDFLIRNNTEVEINMIKNCDHNISVEASSLALRYIKKNFKI